MKWNDSAEIVGIVCAIIIVLIAWGTITWFAM